jgi:glycosyltransferase involved in cell wall biosynthesis
MNINFSCPINNTGYGVASWNILKNLYNLNPDISYFPIGQPSVSSKEDHDLVIKLYNNSYNLDPSAPFVKIWHQFDLASHIGKGTYFALPFFELDTFNTMELSHLKVPDRLLVTSNWAKEVMKSNTINSQVDIVPLGVDRNIFDENKYIKNHNNKYVFLNIGKWEVRKGHDILLELFQKAFPQENDVELWILASENTNNYSSAQELEQWKNMYKSDNRVKLLKSAQNHHEIAQIMNDADCGLFPSRAEGWNLELLEMMSMNKPVIATNYSAHTEFCDNNNCYLINIKEKEKAYDGKAFIGQGYWAKIDKDQKDQTIEHMRNCFNNRIKTNSQGVLTAQKYSWFNSAETLLRCIDNP